MQSLQLITEIPRSRFKYRYEAITVRGGVLEHDAVDFKTQTYICYLIINSVLKIHEMALQFNGVFEFKSARTSLLIVQENFQCLRFFFGKIVSRSGHLSGGSLSTFAKDTFPLLVAPLARFNSPRGAYISSLPE